MTAPLMPPIPLAPPVPLAPTHNGLLAYLRPGSSEWLPITETALKVLNGVEEIDDTGLQRVRSNRATLADLFGNALQMPNLGVFAGSGTSLAPVGGPSMWQLWTAAMCTDPTGDALTASAAAVCETVRYVELESPNIEHFLSRCDAFLAFNESEEVASFVRGVKTVILHLCTDFLNHAQSDISSYRHLLQKLARRRVRDPRLKVFTTNYDMCFETAASDLGMVVVDGFSYTRKRRFDGRHFDFDIVRRESDKHEFVEGIFQLHKLHGSVSWTRHENDIYEDGSPHPDDACLIYPAKGKYQQAFIQPHLELLSRFLDFVRQPNSCLVVSGFGFNDDHLSEPILSAIQSNPSLKLILTDYRCIEHVHNKGHHGSSAYWTKFHELSQKGFDVHFVGGSFSDVIDQIPYLRAVSPAEQLANAVRRLGNGVQQ